MIVAAEADSEHKLVLSKGQRLVEKKELVRAVSDKRQLASNGLQRLVIIRSILPAIRRAAKMPKGRITFVKSSCRMLETTICRYFVFSTMRQVRK